MKPPGLALLVVCVSLLTACEKEPCAPPYSCPTTVDGGMATVDCMPPGDGAPECSGQCHAWLLEQCDVTFLF